MKHYLLHKIKTIIKKVLGVRSFDSQLDSFLSLKFHWAHEEEFNKLYSDACQKTNTKEFILHKIRSYNLLQFLKWAPPSGEIAECGVFRGTTAYQIRSVTKKPIHLFDSFEGISGRDIEDVRSHEEIGSKGIIACSLDEVQRNLSDFDDLKYYQGWIPKRFNEVSHLSFSFVHIDVDVYQPTKDSFDFFYPRMVKGGVMICDDYGFRTWPGCKKAVDEMAQKYGFKVIPLTSGQGIVIK